MGTSEWYLKLDDKQIKMTDKDQKYSTYSVLIDEHNSADDPTGSDFEVDVRLSGMDASSLSGIETYIRYDGDLVSFTSGSGDSSLSPAGITVEPVSGANIIKLTLQGGAGHDGGGFCHKIGDFEI